MKVLGIEVRDGLKPKVKPTYKHESLCGLKVVSLLLMLGSIALTILTVTMGQEHIAFLGIALSTIISGFSSLLGGDYSLAVKIVNSTNVEEWSYNDGIAIMRFSDGALGILDTKVKRIYLSREFSIQGLSLAKEKTKTLIKCIIFVKPMIVNIAASHEFKKARILKGIINVPSIKSEREATRLVGTFLEVYLGSKCLKEINICIEKLLKLLKET